MGEAAPPELDRALAEPGALRIPLGPLGADDAEALVRRALGVEALPPGVAAFIGERAEGNPFFSEQLAYALRDAGHLVVDGPVARLAGGVTDLAGARRARLGPWRGRRPDRRPVALGAAHLEGGQRHRPPVPGRDPHGRPPARGRAALGPQGARAFDRARPDPPRDAGPGPRLPVHPRDHPGGRLRPAHLRPAPSAPPGRRRVVRGARDGRRAARPAPRPSLEPGRA